MRICIKTKVNQDYKKVFSGFNQSLFLKLNPPFPPVKLLKFDGCKKDNKVILRLNFIFFKQTWESLITKDEENNQEIYFIDEGIKLPFFLKYWKHKHIIQNSNTSSLIIDDITFKTPFIILNYLMYPLLYLQFLYRKPIYKKVFK